MALTYKMVGVAAMNKVYFQDNVSVLGIIWYNVRQDVVNERGVTRWQRKTRR